VRGRRMVLKDRSLEALCAFFSPPSPVDMDGSVEWGFCFSPAALVQGMGGSSMWA
jgi:hypothetical protein